MRKLQLVLVAAMLAGTTSVVAAQDAQQQGRGRPNMAAMLMTGITLTAEQQPTIDSLTKRFDEARAALRADQSLDQDARRAKSRELQTKFAEHVKAHLTDEQKKVFEKNQADAQARMQQGGGRPPR